MRPVDDAYPGLYVPWTMRPNPGPHKGAEENTSATSLMPTRHMDRIKYARPLQSRYIKLTIYHHNHSHTSFYSIEDGSVRLGYSRNLHICVVCVCFKGWLRVYFGLDLSLSKLAKLKVAESSGSCTTPHYPPPPLPRLNKRGLKLVCYATL